LVDGIESFFVKVIRVLEIKAVGFSEKKFKKNGFEIVLSDKNMGSE
jgi:hypothetical protein